MAAETLLRGAVVALATPVTAGALDRRSLDGLVTHCVEGGVVGISCCGSTGEGARLSRAERLEVAHAVVNLVPDTVMVVPGLPVTSLTDALAELVSLGDLGVTAALVAPPAYYPPDDTELVRLYSTLADASPVPLLLYNIPMFTAGLPVPVVAALAAHSNIVGTKDSSRDLEYLQAVLAATRGRDFTVFTGTDTLLVPSVLMGAHGAITAGGNVVPDLVAGVLAATTGGDLDRAWELQRRLTAVVDACRGGSFPAGWKAAVQLQGRCSGELVSPATRLSDELTDAMAARLRAAEVL